MSLLKFRSSELVFLDCINFEHLFALVYLLLLPNLFLLYISFQYPLKSSEIFKVFLRFRGVLKKNIGKTRVNITLRGLPWIMYENELWFLDLLSPLYTYVIFLLINPLQLSFKKLPNIKPIEKLPGNNRSNISALHAKVTKKQERIFGRLFVLGWKIFDFIPNASIAIRNYRLMRSRFSAIRCSRKGKNLKVHINVQQGLKNSSIGC